MPYLDSATAIPYARRVLIIGAAINLFLAILKIIVGLSTRSQALVADGVHSFSDLVTDVVAWLGLKFGRAEADLEHPFGHGRMETLASLGVGLTLAATGAVLAYKAGVNLALGRFVIPSAAAAGVAFISVVIKEWLFFYTLRVGRQMASQALVANAWHHRSDSLSSLAVLVGLGLALIRPELAFLDAVAALVVAGLILKVAFDITRQAVSEMVDTALSAGEVARLAEMAQHVPGVLAVSRVKVRRSGPRLLMDCQIEVDGGLTLREAHALEEAVEAVIKAGEPAVAEVTIHVEPK